MNARQFNAILQVVGERMANAGPLSVPDRLERK